MDARSRRLPAYARTLVDSWLEIGIFPGSERSALTRLVEDPNWLAALTILTARSVWGHVKPYVDVEREVIDWWALRDEQDGSMTDSCAAVVALAHAMFSDAVEVNLGSALARMEPTHVSLLIGALLAFHPTASEGDRE